MLEQGDFCFEASTGYLVEDPFFGDFENFLPSSIFRYFKNDEEIGKAVVNYCNFEMGDLSPTIEYFEIVSSMRRKGYGTPSF